MRTFRIQAGDPFYTPRIDGKPCLGGTIEVLPGFDQVADGLVVPWETVTWDGLEITEESSEQLVRCVIGPVDPDTDNKDWLQFRSSLWEPLAQDKWMSLGGRHLLGTVGSAVDIQLTFRDARSHGTEDPADLIEVLHFEHAVRCAPRNTVFLNVFDLASALSIPNAMLCNTVFNTIGAFHAAVEVYNEEWSFYRTPNPTSCGVCRSLRPRHHPVHVYRQSVDLGSTSLKDWEVRYLIRGKLASKWPGGGYDLLHKNCIHFCDELVLSLGVKPVPAWVRGLHETGASLIRIPWPLSLVLGGGGAQKPRALTDGPDGRNDESGDGELFHAETASMGASDTTFASTVGRPSIDPGCPPADGTFIDTDGEESEAPSSRRPSLHGPPGSGMLSGRAQPR